MAAQPTRHILALDDTEVRHHHVRAVIAASLTENGCHFRNFARFWKQFPSDSRRLPTQVMVVADLAELARHYSRVPNKQSWTTSVRRSNVSLLALVRTRADERCAAIVDELVRSSDSRLAVCHAATNADIQRSLLQALAARRPHALTSVRCSPAQRALWVEFGDGLSGHVGFRELGMTRRLPSLVLESAIVGRAGTTIELQQRAGDVFEIDGLAIRALLDRAVRAEIEERSSQTYEHVGSRVRDARVAVGLTQMQLHALSGIDQALISKLERGHHEPRFDTVERIASCLGVSMAALLSGDPPR